MWNNTVKSGAVNCIGALSSLGIIINWVDCYLSTLFFQRVSAWNLKRYHWPQPVITSYDKPARISPHPQKSQIVLHGTVCVGKNSTDRFPIPTRHFWWLIQNLWTPGFLEARADRTTWPVPIKAARDLRYVTSSQSFVEWATSWNSDKSQSFTTIVCAVTQYYTSHECEVKVKEKSEPVQVPVKVDNKGLRLYSTAVKMCIAKFDNRKCKMLDRYLS